MKKMFKSFYKKLPFEISIRSYKLIFIFLFPIFGVAHNRMRDKYAKNKIFFFSMLMYFMSYLLSFIPVLIYLICNRIKEKKENDDKKDNDTDANDIVEVEDDLNNDIFYLVTQRQKKIELKKNIIIVIFLCCFSAAFSYFDFLGNSDKKTIGMAYKIPIYIILSIFLLKYKYYFHHFIIFGINVITLLTKYSLGIIQSNSQKWVTTHLWQYLLFAFFDCLLLTIGKYYMDKFDKTPYFIMFMIGIINGIIIISIAIMKYLITSESQLFSYFNNNINSRISISLFFGDLITQFLYNLGSWITVYYFTPLHTIISENTIEIYYMIYDYKSNKKYWEESGYVWNSWVIPSALVINLICSLIFNEIIILKCCKCDYYTKIRIEERERKDARKILDSLDKSFDTDSSSRITDDSNSENQ